MNAEDLAPIARLADKSMYGGAGTAIFGLFTVNDVAAILGALAAIVGAAVSVYCKLSAKRRSEQEHALIMEERRLRNQRLAAGQYVPPDPAVGMDE